MTAVGNLRSNTVFGTLYASFLDTLLQGVAINGQTLTKERIRHWIEQRATTHKPLPSLRQLRREHGIDMVDAQINKRRRY
jgi:hypothetical protein